jgi:hypothetical protein
VSSTASDNKRRLASPQHIKVSKFRWAYQVPIGHRYRLGQAWVTKTLELLTRG